MNKPRFRLEKELEELYKSGYFRHVSKCNLYKTKIGNRMMEVEDLEHETYVRCLTKQSLYKHTDKSGLRGWISIVCCNVARNHRRVVYGRSCLFETYIEGMNSDEGHYDENRGFYKLLLEQLVTVLTPKDLDLLQLLGDGYTHREISRLRNIPQNTISSFARRWRGGKGLKGKLEDLRSDYAS